MKKKCFSIALLLFLLMGCNNNGSNSNSNYIDDSNCYIKENTTIEFLCLTDNSFRSELNRMINEFQNVEPHVTVNLTNPAAAGNYNVLEKTVISGFYKEDYPDIVQCFPDNVVKYIDYDKALELNQYLNNETYGLKEEKADYIESFLNEGSKYKIEGTYSLPFCKSTELMYYNAEVLIGLDLSAEDASINNGQPLTADYLNNLTWEELFNKLCPALKAHNSTTPIYIDDESSGIVTYDSDENFFITLANQYNYGYTSVNDSGKGSVDFDNANMKGLMKTLRSAKDNGYLQTRGSYDDYVSYLFTGKKSLFTISSTAGLSYNYDKNNPFKIGVAKLPKAEGKEYCSINQGPSVCLLDHNDENRSLASYLFWKYITNEKNSSLWAVNTGYMGIRESSYTSPEYLAALEVNDKDDLYQHAVSDNLKLIKEVSTTTFNTPVFRGSSNARTNVGKLLKDCLTVSDLDAEIDTLFKNYSDDAKSYLGD